MGLEAGYRPRSWVGWFASRPAITWRNSAISCSSSWRLSRMRVLPEADEISGGVGVFPVEVGPELCGQHGERRGEHAPVGRRRRAGFAWHGGPVGAAGKGVPGGHRLRLDVSSSCFDRWDRNPNTGARFGYEATPAVAEQTIHHSAAHPSHIALPIMPAR